ncbi:MAG TPA: hypothetical protein VK074_00565 [Fodinibius sp.]|nr:hypothetical protein [Fodinibius sp.]
MQLQWQIGDPEGTLDILIARTNKFKAGKQDTYQTMQTVPVEDGSASIQVDSSSFYKMVLEAPHNTLNRWLIVN